MKMPSSITARNNNHHTPPAAPTPPPQTSAISLSRLIVLLVAAAAGVLYHETPPSASNAYSQTRTNNLSGPTGSASEELKGNHSRHRPRAASDGLLAAPAAPDADAVSLDRRLAAKGARVAGVLADFHLLDLFAERGAVSAVPVLLDGVSGRRVWLGRGEGGWR